MLYNQGPQELRAVGTQRHRVPQMLVASSGCNRDANDVARWIAFDHYFVVSPRILERWLVERLWGHL